jgi:hypothetical protein
MLENKTSVERISKQTILNTRQSSTPTGNQEKLMGQQVMIAFCVTQFYTFEIKGLHLIRIFATLNLFFLYYILRKSTSLLDGSQKPI